MPALEKGQHGPLSVTKEANHRVFVGLGWDPNEKSGLVDKAKEMVGGAKTWHDLDLSCFVYNANREFIEKISATDGKHADDRGQIYHSGDNIEGIGDGDDEQISVELKDLDENIAHIVFTVTIKSGHVFGDISSPVVRLADGYSGHTFLKTELNASKGADKSGFIFVHLYRKDDVWMVHNIHEFMNAKDMKEWPALMSVHLETQ